MASQAARDLFGGAMRITLPSTLIDVSDLRPVPDNQEVFCTTDGSHSVVVECLEYQADVPDNGIAQHLFDDLVDANGGTAKAPTHTIHSNQFALPFADSLGLTKVWLQGQQSLAKGHEMHHITIHLCAIRVPQHRSDLLISFSSPEEPSAEDNDTIARLFGNIIQSFAVLDWSVFDT